MLEELVDKTIVHVDRLAPVAFDRAYDELISFHTFLLDLNASSTPGAAAFSFAEISGSYWSSPHELWAREYTRLFERSLRRLSDDNHFSRTISYTPNRLLSGDAISRYSPAVVQSILDLTPNLVYRLESWITKRTIAERSLLGASQTKIALSDSDAQAYAGVVHEVLGAWEALLTKATREEYAEVDEPAWSHLQTDWPLLWRHLRNTSLCLAIAIWNDDRVGSRLFAESLTRWADVVDRDYEVGVTDGRWALPDVIALSWSEAKDVATKRLGPFGPPVSPSLVRSSIVRATHRDVLVLTSALLLSWIADGKQASEMSAIYASSLLGDQLFDDDRVQPNKLGFRDVLLVIARIAIVEQRRVQGSYGYELDHLVQALDSMTEREVVPGRVFTPSTFHSTDELRVALAAMLAALSESDLSVDLLDTLERANDVFPGGMQSLDAISRELKAIAAILRAPPPSFERALLQLHSTEADSPSRDLQAGRVADFLETICSKIAADKQQRLEASPISWAKLEELRSFVERELFSKPLMIPGAGEVPIEPAAPSGKPVPVRMRGIPKGQFVEPSVDPPSLNFGATIAGAVRAQVTRTLLQDMYESARSVHLRVPPTDPIFWGDIAGYAKSYERPAVLLISHQDAAWFHRQHYDPQNLPSEMEVVWHKTPRRRSYLATVNGIDVCSSSIATGRALLLEDGGVIRVDIGEAERNGEHLSMTYEVGDGTSGSLEFLVFQSLVKGVADFFVFSWEPHDDGSDALG